MTMPSSLLLELGDFTDARMIAEQVGEHHLLKMHRAGQTIRGAAPIFDCELNFRRLLDAARQPQAEVLTRLLKAWAACCRTGCQAARAVAAGGRAGGLQFTLGIGIAVLIVLWSATTPGLGGPNFAELGAIFVASTLSSIAGFAFSAICGAILFHIDDQPVHIVQVMIVCSIAIQFFSVITLRNEIGWRYLGRFLFGGAIGLPVGVYLLTHLATSEYMKFVGLLLIIYGCYMLLRRPVVRVFSSRAGDYAAGFLGGITGGLAGFPGAFVTIWCGFKGWDKNRQRGVYQPFILIMQVLALGSITFVQSSHGHGNGLDPLTLSYVPGAILGTWCGIAIFHRLTDRQFARLVNLLLIVSGMGLIA